jgi:hypothetical protein
MDATNFLSAGIKASPIAKALRFVIVKDETVRRKRMEFYTGNHDSPESVWTTDPRAAVIYAHMVLATNDLRALREGRLPEGRRGVKTKGV